MSGEIHQQNDRNANVNVNIDTGQITVPETDVQDQLPGGLNVKARYQDVVEKDPSASPNVAANLYSSQPKLPQPKGGSAQFSADASEALEQQILLEELEAQQELDQNVPPGTEEQSLFLHQQGSVYHANQKLQDLHKTNAGALGLTTLQDFAPETADVKKAKAAQAAAQAKETAETPEPQATKNTTNPLDGIPGITSSIIPAPDSGAAGMLKGSIALLQDSQTILKKYAPQGQGMVGVSIFDMLKAVSAALSNAQQMLYQIEDQNTEGRKDVTNIQWDEQKSQIAVHKKAFDDQQDQQAEIDKHQHKANVTNLVLKILTPIVIAVSIIATVASFGTLGPAAIVISTIMLAAMVTSQAGGPDWMRTALQAAGNWLGDTLVAPILGPMGVPKRWAELVTELMIIVIIVIATRNPENSAAMTAAFTSQLLGESNLITDTLVQSGVPEMDAQIAGAAAVAVIGFSSLAFGMGKAIANQAKTVTAMEEAIAATEADIAARAARAAKMSMAAADAAAEENATVSVSRTVIKDAEIDMLKIKLFIQKTALTIFRQNIEKTAEAVEQVFKVGQSTTEMMQAYFEYGIKMGQAAIKRIKADEDAQSARLEDFIQALKTVIKQLLDMMNAIVQGVATIDQLQIKKYDVAKVQFRA